MSEPASRTVFFHLFGYFSATTPDGVDLSPRGAKAKAILTMLCLDPGHRLSRRTIESLLWSTRDDDQASSSMRQALSEIRRSLKSFKGLIVTDRDEVWFNPEIQIQVQKSDHTSTAQLLEGIRIRDPAFEAWLKNARLDLLGESATELATSPANIAHTSPARPTLALLMHQASGSQGDFIQELIHQQLVRNINDESSVSVVSLASDSSMLFTTSGAYNLSLRTLECDETVVVLLQLQSCESGKVIWTRQERFNGGLHQIVGSSQISRLADETTQLSLSKLVSGLPPAQAAVPEFMLHHALRELFTFDASKLVTADALLSEAAQLDPHPVHFAWRSFLRIPMWVEQLRPISGDMLADAGRFLEIALENGNENGMVHAIASQYYLTLKRDADVAKSFAEDAIALNPGNPLAHLSSALISLRKGELDPAKKSADKALSIARLSPFRHWWYSVCCAVEIARGDYLTAISHGESALAHAPKSKPPLRHLYALYLKVGQYDKAAETHAKLSELEPFFSLEYARNDPTYPATTLRSSTLIELPDLDSVLASTRNQT